MSFIAACVNGSLFVWNIETGERVFRDVSHAQSWIDIAMSNDIVAAYSCKILTLWSISTGKQLLHRELSSPGDSCGLAISSCGGVVMYGRDEGVEIVEIPDFS